MHRRPSGSAPSGRARWAAVLVLLLAHLAAPAPGALAAPGSGPAPAAVGRHVPDWMSDDTARSLDLGFDILVPAELPAPFDSEPSVTASAGAYSLYWLIPGTPPTFLEITGTVGGEIPDYSKYDRNVELTQNATVNGVAAYHDLTPIYDLVYWEIGGVVYSVESRNLADTDSLSLAESLAVLQQPGDTGGTSTDPGDTPVEASIDVPDRVAANDTATITVAGGGTLTADAGQFPESGSATLEGVGDGQVDWQAPAVTDDTWVSFTLSDPDSGDVLASASLLVAAAAPPADLALACPAQAAGGDTLQLTLSGGGDAIVDASGGLFPDGSPNGDFGTIRDGETIQGSLADGASVTLAWIAPDVAEETVYYLFASTPDGRTPGECAVTVSPGDGGDSTVSHADVGTGGSEADEAARGVAGDGTGTEGIALPQSEDSSPTPTPKPRKKSDKTPVYDEVIGLPTVAADGGDGQGQAPKAKSPTPSATKSAAPRPTPTLAPTIGQDGMVAITVGAAGGTLSNPAGAKVDVPAGAIDRDATLSIQPVADTKLPIDATVNLVPGTAFDIALASADGRAISALAQPATIRIELGAEKLRDGARIYRVSGTELQPVDPSSVDGTAVVARTSAFSRFVVGVPAPATTSTKRSALPFILGAGFILVLLIALVVLGGMLRPRRARSVGVGRTPPRSRYR